MESLSPSSHPPENRPDGQKPLDVRLEITSEARVKLAAALTPPDGRDKWLRIFPQGIS